MGTLADETGCIAAGKMVWSDQALTQLFFGNAKDNNTVELVRKTKCLHGDIGGIPEDGLPLWQDITWLNKDDLRSIEERMMYARLTLTFGWSHQVVRLCVLWVEW